MKTVKYKYKIILLFILISGNASVNAQTVYITKTGEKYHKSNCHYLSKSSYSISLADAKAEGYISCKICKPITVISKHNTNQNKIDTLKITPNAKSTKCLISRQCSAYTKSGNRCKRKTTDPSSKCWQHK